MWTWFKGAVRAMGGKLDHSLQDANDARRVADSLSGKAPVKALQEASQWLISIQQTVRLWRHSRFELIDLLDATTRKAQARTRPYAASPLCR